MDSGETGFVKIRKMRGELGRSILEAEGECQVALRRGVNLSRRLWLEVPLY